MLKHCTHSKKDKNALTERMIVIVLRGYAVVQYGLFIMIMVKEMETNIGITQIQPIQSSNVQLHQIVILVMLLGRLQSLIYAIMHNQDHIILIGTLIL